MSAALIIGAGDATGGAIAKAFAAEGFTACVNRRPRHANTLEELAQSIRDAGNAAQAFPSDARDEDAMIALVDSVERDVGPIEVAVFNIGANVRFNVTDTTAQVYRKVWEMAAFAGFLMGREVARHNHFYRRDCLNQGRRRLLCFLWRKGCTADACAIHGPRIGAPRHPRCTQHYRWWHRHRICAWSAS